MNRITSGSAIAVGGAALICGAWALMRGAAGTPEQSLPEADIPLTELEPTSAPLDTTATSWASLAPLSQNEDLRSATFPEVSPDCELEIQIENPVGYEVSNAAALTKLDSSHLLRRLRELKDAGTLTMLTDSEKAAIYKHALSVDPFQIYVRGMALEDGPMHFGDRLEQNGPIVFSGYLDDTLVFLAIAGTGENGFACLDNGMPIPLDFEHHENGMLFRAGDDERALIEGYVRSSQRGLLLDIHVHGLDWQRLEVWRGVELPSAAPPSIMDEIGQLLSD